MTVTERVLIHFLDGPLAGRGNTQGITGADAFLVPRDQYGWPLPRRLRVLAHLEHAQSVAVWNPDVEEKLPDALPPAITRSPNAITYVKESESQLPEPDPDARVVRGAAYRMERP